MIRQSKGFFTPGMSLSLIALAAVGCWYMYRSYSNGELKNDLGSMLADCKRISGSANMTSADQASMTQAYSTLSRLSAKYNLDGVKAHQLSQPSLYQP